MEKKNVVRYIVFDCRGRIIDSESKGWRKWKKKKEYFVKLILRNENYVITLLVFKESDIY